MEKDNIKFKEIKDFPNYYISRCGKVYSSHRDKILSLHIIKGYYIVVLRKQNKSYTKLVHRLVAENYLSDYKDNLTVNHKDGNKLNNHSDNLEWCTQSENLKHSYKYLNRMPNYEGLKKSWEKKRRKVCQYNRKGELKKIWDSIMDIEKELGIHNSHIVSVCKNRSKTAGNYIWKYYEE